ncbi:MAG: RICIN domain-containing protein [Lachnospiraceae bacterium]|nr:RICIN domain-containing protein [Lachnospiraceae bacterium]
MIGGHSVKHNFIKTVLMTAVLVGLMAFGTVSAGAAVKKLGSDAGISEGYYVLVPQCAPTRSLNVKNSSRKNGGNINIYSYLDKARQVFYIDSIGNGKYRITNKNSGKSVEVKNKSTKANVRQNSKKSTNRQKWYISKRGSGYVIQSAAYKNRVLTVKNSGNKNKTNVISSPFTGKSGQIWKLVRYGSVEEAAINSKLDKKVESAETVEQIGEIVESLDDNEFGGSSVTGTSSGTRKYRSTVNGRKTLTAYLQNAMVPVGRTLYIWGGGWGDSDASVIGYQSKWEKFFNKHATASYNYQNYRYSYGNGLDCSGFVGWTIYNTLYKTAGKKWLVYQSSTVASTYADKGWAKLARYSSDDTFAPGDVVSMSGHVWISLGQCSDGSVLLVHSSPRGVQISGSTGKAATLAKKYMKKYFPEWPYEARTVTTSYLSYVAKARWKTSGSGSILKDPDGVQKMSAEQVMKFLLGPV